MLNIKTFYFNDLRECTYVVWDETGECVIVDPGCHSESEKGRLENFIETNNLKPIMLLNTHGHFDHVMGNAFVTAKWNIVTHIHPDDKSYLERCAGYGDMFGYKIDEAPGNTIDLKDGEVLKIGSSYLKVMHTPGHSRGGVCFYNEEDKIVFSGDSLFAGSIGRTDLPGGDYDQLMESLLGRVVKLGDDYSVYPGHGPVTTIGHELSTNPFLRYE